MKLSSVLLFAVTASTGVSHAASLQARDMDMDMDMDMMRDETSEHNEVEHDSSPASTEVSQLEPVPHEPKHLHGQPILETHLTAAERLYWENYNTTTFFTTDKGNRSAFWAHVFTLVTASVFLYPICLALNNIESGWYIPVLSLYNVTILVSLLCLSIFDASFPESWYAHNIYRPMSYILLIVTLVHFVSAIIVKTSKWISLRGYDRELGFELNDLTDEGRFTPLQTSEDGASSIHGKEETSRFGGPLSDKRASYNPRDSVGSPTTTLYDPHNPHDDLRASRYRNDSNSFELDGEDLAKNFDLEDRLLDGEGFQLKHQSKTSIKRDTYLAKLFSSPILQSIAVKFSAFFLFIFKCLNYPMMMYFFVYLSTGLAVGNLLGKEKRIFNLLAHWIKGGVFISFGVVSLARYCGFGAKRGFAWNKIVIFKNQVDSNSLWFKLVPRGGITMEFFESSLIAFYGCTNVFLEHLANPGGKWEAKDLQHVSIAFMYIGCGFCGILAEIKLSEWRYNHVLKHTNIEPGVIHSGYPGYSPNPFPAFTIFWTGILMSQHAQASATSTTIHVQWGSLLSYGSFFRIFTFILLMLVPNQNLDPSRPFTELITSFCMLCGGLVFMESTDQVVEAMEYRGFTPMFTFNLSVGFVAIFMALEMALFMWKDWLKARMDNR